MESSDIVILTALFALVALCTLQTDNDIVNNRIPAARTLLYITVLLTFIFGLFLAIILVSDKL